MLFRQTSGRMSDRIGLAAFSNKSDSIKSCMMTFKKILKIQISLKPVGYALKVQYLTWYRPEDVVPCCIISKWREAQPRVLQRGIDCMIHGRSGRYINASWLLIWMGENGNFLLHLHHHLCFSTGKRHVSYSICTMAGHPYTQCLDSAKAFVWMHLPVKPYMKISAKTMAGYSTIFEGVVQQKINTMFEWY